MSFKRKMHILLVLAGTFSCDTTLAQEKPVVGLIPTVQKLIAMDGKLTGWEGAFVTPVHVGHPDFANRGGQLLYLWDEKNLYIGLRCLNQSRHTSASTRKSGTATRSSSTSTPDAATSSERRRSV